jgi:MFS family permease
MLSRTSSSIASFTEAQDKIHMKLTDHPAISYNIGILTSVYVNPGFIKALHKPNAAQKGLITAIYYLGTWVSYVFLSGPLSERLGRRYAALTGAVVTCVGGAVQTGAHGKDAYAMMIIGRIISGLGNAVISTSVPLYQRFVGNEDFSMAIWKLIIAAKLLQQRREADLLC